MMMMIKSSLRRDLFKKPLRGNKCCSRARVPDFLEGKNITGGFAYESGDQQRWHTNHNKSGMESARCYLVWSDTGDSGMRFIIDGVVTTFQDVPGWQYRIFNIPQPHCVFADCKRLSYGWAVEKVENQILTPTPLDNAEAVLQFA
tara:strand:+ start:961 stop:1395 length:435 start_codon:yes stop_codon:yes gene_type:complete